ncbi:MAG: nucleotidyltransferase family protein [Bacteroidales bacterium]|nr:nucleotidyltransferase family protein [Bacteroidales bacterium]
MKTTDEILTLLEEFKPYAQQRYGITRIGVFGSVARGEQREDSDVDICYEGRVLSLLTIDMLQRELEKLLGSKVDAVRIRDNMNPLLHRRINTEGLYV